MSEEEDEPLDYGDDGQQASDLDLYDDEDYDNVHHDEFPPPAQTTGVAAVGEGSGASLPSEPVETSSGILGSSLTAGISLSWIEAYLVHAVSDCSRAPYTLAEETFAVQLETLPIGESGTGETTASSPQRISAAEEQAAPIAEQAQGELAREEPPPSIQLPAPDIPLTPFSGAESILDTQAGGEAEDNTSIGGDTSLPMETEEAFTQDDQASQPSTLDVSVSLVMTDSIVTTAGKIDLMS